MWPRSHFDVPYLARRVIGAQQTRMTSCLKFLFVVASAFFFVFCDALGYRWTTRTTKAMKSKGRWYASMPARPSIRPGSVAARPRINWPIRRNASTGLGSISAIKSWSLLRVTSTVASASGMFTLVSRSRLFNESKVYLFQLVSLFLFLLLRYNNQGRKLLELMDHTQAVRDLAFAPDGSLRLVSASLDRTIKVRITKETS